MTTLTHWLMTALIGVRIYVDNFTLDMDDTYANTPNTGDYKVAPLTGYMIGCAIYVLANSFLDHVHHNKQAVVLQSILSHQSNE